MRLYLSSYRLGNKPEELLRLLKGKESTALILNAMDFVSTEDRAADLGRETERLKSIGLEPTEVDLRQYFGKPDDLKEELAGFDLLWVRGGNAFVLRRAFRQSGLDRLLPELLEKDTLVYGGYSAGNTILVPNLAGTELVDDPNLVPKGYDPEIIWEGLGIMPYEVVPHYKSDHPESADIDISVQYLIDHHMPFIALRDGQVIIVDENGQRVVA